MRALRLFVVLSLPLSVSLAVAQGTQCNPCVDGPDTLRTPLRIEMRSGPATSRDPASPGEIAGMIRASGGTLSDLTHDCGAAVDAIYREIMISARACSWGGRYPALLIEPADATDSRSLIVLASNGAGVEVLFEGTPPASMVNVFGGILKQDFDGLFREVSDN